MSAGLPPAPLVLGVMGDARVARSLSPAMHNAVLAGRGIKGWYAAYPVEPGAVAAAVAGIRALGFRGMNVTVPHKQAVMPHLDGLDGLARRVGAVNTIVNDAGKLTGHNTDVIGFLSSLLEAGYDPKGRPALMAGAGGASRAALAALIDAGADPVLVTARRREAAEALTGELGGQVLEWSGFPGRAGEYPLLVNATAASAPAEGPELAASLERARAHPGGLVFDLNYGRTGNFWADLAHRGGAAFRDGLDMLVHQARASFALWTGVEAGPEEFRAGFKA